MLMSMMLLGMVLLVVDMGLYIAWLFTDSSPFIYSEFCMGCWLPLYITAMIHAILSKHLPKKYIIDSF